MATIKDGKGTLTLSAFDADCNMGRHEVGRPAPGPSDVHIDIKFCGMCHSDVHACDGSWGVNKFPIAPGHEIAGVVRAVGAEVKTFKAGDRVGVGCMVGSCGTCDQCKAGLEQHCNSMLQTYSSVWPEGKGAEDCIGYHTNGGYSTQITVNQHFVFSLPDSIGLEEAGPLLCAGITTYSPLARHVLGKSNQTVGVVGFGGLGHMAIKIAKAMGARVVALSRSDAKKAAAEKLGAELLVHTDDAAMAAAARTFDVIIDTVSAQHDVVRFLKTLRVGGTIVMVGAPPEPYAVGAFDLIFNRVGIEGSLIGGVPETQEMLDFCAKHNIRADIKVVNAREAIDCFKELQRGEGPARRNVIDVSTIADL